MLVTTQQQVSAVCVSRPTACPPSLLAAQRFNNSVPADYFRMENRSIRNIFGVRSKRTRFRAPVETILATTRSEFSFEAEGDFIGFCVSPFTPLSSKFSEYDTCDRHGRRLQIFRFRFSAINFEPFVFSCETFQTFSPRLSAISNFVIKIHDA